MDYWRLKELILEHYGKSCIYCDQDDPKQLRVIFADKNMQSWRGKFGLESTKDFYYYLYKKNFPAKFKMPGKYKLVVLCKFHYNEFASEIRKDIPRSPEIRQKIGIAMRAKKG